MNTEQAIEELSKITTEVKTSFGQLTIAQLNWKPDKDKWSIAQCLHHLIVSNETYYPQLKDIISGKYRNSFYQNFAFISRIIGKRMIKDLGPVVTKSFKNPQLFTPSQSDIPATIIKDFEGHQQKLAAYIARLKDVNLENTVLRSPVTKIIIYNLADLLQIIAGHEQRHLAQAKRVKDSMSGAL